MLRAALAATLGLSCALLALVQCSSDAMATRFISHKGIALISRGTARNMEMRIFAIDPAPFLAEDLSRDALASNHLETAERIAIRMPPTSWRNELLMRIEDRRGHVQLASEYALAAPDPVAIATFATRLARENPYRGYAYLQIAIARIRALGAHPDVLAEQEWQSGVIAATASFTSKGHVRTRWTELALASYERAARLSPYSQTYLLASGTQAWLNGHPTLSRRYFARALAIDPRSVNALAGLGVVAVALGHRAEATMYLRRARSIDPSASFVRTLEHLVH